jgi:hypothetical protein
MQSVAVCLGCRRTINKEYLYCPWCGLEKMEGHGLDTLDSVFDRLEALQYQDRMKYIEKLEAELADLEKELDNLTLSTELHS